MTSSDAETDSKPIIIIIIIIIEMHCNLIKIAHRNFLELLDVVGSFS